MTQIAHFLKLVRFGNILIIAFTMCVVKFLVFEAWLAHDLDSTLNELDLYNSPNPPSTINFILLVISICSIGAAGNIINDYFDTKADRVNRPDTIVIGKHIKRRVAIVTHWGLNILGVSLAAYLGWYYQSFTLLIVPVIASIILWWYSVYLKRKLIVGNIAIAILTALVIIITCHFMRADLPVKIDGVVDYDPAIFLSGILAGFAAICNFTREIVKDLHDVDGDMKMGCKTMPIEFGAPTTKLAIGVLLFIQLLFFVLMLVFGASKFNAENISWYPISIGISLIILYIIAFVINIIAKGKKEHYRISFILKLIMLIGLLFPLTVLI